MILAVMKSLISRAGGSTLNYLSNIFFERQHKLTKLRQMP